MSDYVPDERDKEVFDEVERVRPDAEKSGLMRCFEGEAMIFVAHDKAVAPGHIYSELGIREARITRCCEYHFDRLDEDWVDPMSGLTAAALHERGKS